MEKEVRSWDTGREGVGARTQGHRIRGGDEEGRGNGTRIWDEKRRERGRGSCGMEYGIRGEGKGGKMRRLLGGSEGGMPGGGGDGGRGRYGMPVGTLMACVGDP